MRLENTKKIKPKQVDEVSSNLRQMTERFHCDLKNLRASTFALEFDLFPKNDKQLDLQLVKVLSEYEPVIAIRDLGKEELQPVKNKKEAIKLVMDLLEQERYWECHEIVESIWRRENDSVEKSLQQGVILFVSALVHAQKNEKDVSLGMLRRSREKMQGWKQNEYYGLNIDTLKQSISEMLEKQDFLLPNV